MIPPPLQWVRFLKLRIVSLWGGSGSNGGAGGDAGGPVSAAEPYAFSFVYCTLTSIEIFGQTMLQARRRRRDNQRTIQIGHDLNSIFIARPTREYFCSIIIDTVTSFQENCGNCLISV